MHKMTFSFKQEGLSDPDVVALATCFPASLPSYCGTQGLLFVFSLVDQDPPLYLSAFEPVVGIDKAQTPFAALDPRANPFELTSAIFDIKESSREWVFTAKVRLDDLGGRFNWDDRANFDDWSCEGYLKPVTADLGTFSPSFDYSIYDTAWDITASSNAKGADSWF
jgi:hypothetical protein